MVLGDLNCDPVDGDSRREALLALLAHPRVQDPQPQSLGGPEQKLKQFGVNMQHQGEPGLDTGDFTDDPGEGPGNLRVDYVLPSRDLAVARAAVVPEQRSAMRERGATPRHGERSRARWRCRARWWWSRGCGSGAPSIVAAVAGGC